MKKNKIYLFIFLMPLYLISCSSDIKNKELGLFIKCNGLAPKEIKVFANGKEVLNNNIKFGQQLTIVLNGIDDFEKDRFNFVHPGGENSVVDEKNKILFFVEDYFKKYGDKGVLYEDSKSLKFNLTLGKPMVRGAKYYFLFRLWDKLNKKELKGNMEVNVL